MSNLAGIHDREGAHLVSDGGWCLDVLGLSERPAPTDYTQLAPKADWIVRLSWGFGSTGTLPVPERYPDFAKRAAAYVAGSKGCSRWQIGNEASLSREWPDGQPIMPAQYAECYLRSRAAIHAIPGHERDEVLIAASGPWNDELKYPGNPNGDWIQNFADTIRACGNDIDGFSIHTYTHGYNTALVTSEATMDAPFQNRHFEFRTYRDYLGVIPSPHRDKTVYITEANGNGPWQAVGLMPAMLEEINGWNNTGKPPIRAVIFYRYPRYDDFYMDGKPDVIAEYKEAVGRGYTSPVGDSMTETFIPVVSSGATSAPALPPRNIDPRATARGVNIGTPANLQQGQTFWYVRSIKWFDETQSQGRHHIYVEALDKDGKPISAPFTAMWPNGSAPGETNGRAGFDAGNFPMSKSLNEFSVVMAGGGYPSERVTGIGMGMNGNSGIHTSTGVVFQLVTMPAATEPVTPTPAPAIAYVIAPSGVNLRAAPINGEIITAIAYGEQVRITGVGQTLTGGTSWYKVRYGEHEGWAAAQYIGVTEPEPLPAPAPNVPPKETPMSPGIIEPRVAQAILKIESGGRTHGPDGRVIIRFEAHIFQTKLGNNALWAQHFRTDAARGWVDQMWRRTPNDTWHPIHTGKQADEWTVFDFARGLNSEAACKSISMGSAQIMGFNAARIGYPSASAMLKAFNDAQLQTIGFINFFISDPVLMEAMQRKDWRTVALRYNGAGQVDHYAKLLEQAYMEGEG